MIHPTATKIPKFMDHQAHLMMVKRLKHQMKVLRDQKKVLDYQEQRIQKMI